MSSVIQVQPPSAIRLLREATAQAHADIEALPYMADLAGGTLDMPRYIQVLRCHLSLLAPWENAHAPWLESSVMEQGWTYRYRAPPLLHDLAALGLAAEISLGRATKTVDHAWAWGMLYVVEGSMLGGRVIARQLRMHQPALEGALSYFDLGREDPGAWRQFQRCLDAALDTAASRERAAAGAAAMFAHFHHHLSVGISA